MRRLALLSLAPVAAVAMALAGCDSAKTGTPTAAGTSASADASAAPGVDPSGVPGASASASDAVTANTRQVCDQINQAVSQYAAAFGTDLGTLAGHLAGKNQAAATKAKNDAVGHLKTMAAKIRTAAAAATDPTVQEAARDTASKVDALAADPNLLANVKTPSDLAPVIEKLTRATDAMNKVCI